MPRGTNRVSLTLGTSPGVLAEVNRFKSINHGDRCPQPAQRLLRNLGRIATYAPTEVQRESARSLGSALERRSVGPETIATLELMSYKELITVVFTIASEHVGPDETRAVVIRAYERDGLFRKVRAAIDSGQKEKVGTPR